MNKKWFTLIELLVVICVLSILSVIWFISISTYRSSVKNDDRVIDVKTMWAQVSKAVGILWNVPSNYCNTGTWCAVTNGSVLPGDVCGSTMTWNLNLAVCSQGCYMVTCTNSTCNNTGSLNLPNMIADATGIPVGSPYQVGYRTDDYQSYMSYKICPKGVQGVAHLWEYGTMNPSITFSLSSWGRIFDVFKWDANP